MKKYLRVSCFKVNTKTLKIFLLSGPGQSMRYKDFGDFCFLNFFY